MNSGKPQDQLLARVLSGPLTPELSAELDAWLREDPANPELLAQFILLEDMLGAARKESAATSVLELLLEMEENAEPILVTHLPDPPASSRLLSFTQNSGVKWFALAAGILLCITAGLWGLSTLFTSTSNQPAPTAINTSPNKMPAESAPPILRDTPAPTVATLTATHNASWASPQAERALARGSELTAGTRLTLTAGFAEITTEEGAVVILEAPATVELLKNDNAIRLHTGKLVGICETDASKGFLVRTPQMDITDLGTRFGVIATKKSTETTVLSGRIAVATVSAESEHTIELTAGARALALAATGTIQRIDSDAGPGYVHDWRALTPPPSIQGQAAYEPSLPMRLDMNQYKADEITLFLESCGITLKHPMTVTIDEPGFYTSYQNLQNQLPKGTVLDSYLVHLDLPSQVDPLNDRRLATITFDRPILGVLATDAHMLDAGKAVGQAGVRYAYEALGAIGPEGCGYALDGALDGINGDRVEISKDRRTLKLNLQIGSATDQFRVLVEPQSNRE